MRQTSRVFLLLVLGVLFISQIPSISARRENSHPFFKKTKFDPIPHHVKLESELDAGETLYASKYVDDHKTAKKLSCVEIGAPFTNCKKLESIDYSLDATTDPFSFSGFITVNETDNSNLFYWFFEAQNGNKDAPVVLFLQGGPGASSLFGLFSENGPYAMLPNLTMVPRNPSWNTNYSMIYIDNPVGTGFSFTEGALNSNEDEIASNLFSCLQQFFKLYPEYADNEFYVAGESYGSRYISALAYYTIQQNYAGVNLKGIAIGDGFADLRSMVTQYANLCFYTGLCDMVQTGIFEMYQAKIIAAIDQEQWLIANDLFTDLVNGPPDLFTNYTGSSNYYDIRTSSEPSYGGDFETFVNSTQIRQLLHVGNHYFQDNDDVYNALREDIPKSSTPLYPPILSSGMKVMLYNGNMDFIVHPTLTEYFITTIPWSGIPFLYESPRIIWRLPSDPSSVAGYVKQYQNFIQVTVRDAGHMVPFNQPERALDMITRFIENLPFPS
ncbi:hypothetical protein CYY_008189 [Polysphondylium violaceum]|uniref:Carboxypeptidase n=1 Tax=Polysphondylium violaceum TaxID=133409 RepID=A0A8J4PPM9_9MYCE|nr:hypothetical protein CYY_008189 [Polysphondylium violaceum]